jgi:hypothetical protein
LVIAGFLSVSYIVHSIFCIMRPDSKNSINT